MFTLFRLALVMVLPLTTYAQLKGVVRDSQSQEPLGGATISLVDENQVMITNAQGEFQFSDLAKKSYTVEIRFVGYKTQKTTAFQNQEIIILLEESVTMTDDVIVMATRAGEKTPTTFSTMNEQTIRKQNFGQDLPIVLNWSPSVVTTSDAGNGVGYTGISIRGSDATRINVTLNGIPYNDSESQGVFWVDIPDMASSTHSIQIQRGVGTSTNGAGAFGATINLQTNSLAEDPYGEWISSIGSFNTFRNTLGLGTGLIKNHWVVDGRLSRISSDGFIDRATSDLTSYYFSGGYYSDKTILKAIVFGGKEVTYQSWYGVPESRLNDDEEAMLVTAANEGWNEIQTQNLLNSSSRTFNAYLYENQVDDYAQDHYQLHASHQLSSSLTANASLHYTYGRGYYEEHRYDDDFEAYGLSPISIGDSVITSTDLIRRRWLDNDFYGMTFSFQYEQNRISSVFGGAWNRYTGKHFGEIIWAQVSDFPKDYQYYFSDSDKKDVNVYLKSNYQLTSKLNSYLDLQVRKVSYQAAGNDNQQNVFDVNANYTFFNPKLGFIYLFKHDQHVYASYAIGNREPVRKDFIDNPTSKAPKPERLNNVEIGYRKNTSLHSFDLNFYWMNYKDQLVLTGALNDVGAPIRVNVDKSYRAGIELDGWIKLSQKFDWKINLTLSQNKISEFTEVLYDYGISFDEYNEILITYTDTDIALSPDIIGGSVFSFHPFQSAEISLLTKYVGDQYLDNTSTASRKIDAYLTNDLRLAYTLKPKGIKEIGFHLLVNNVLNVDYESNGYTYGYLGGGEQFRENYYYPQAGRNILAMVSVKF